MKIHYLPTTIRALIFDMDLTLYTHPEYAQIQIDNLVRIAGAHRGLDEAAAARTVKAARESWAASHGGEQRSLSSIILSWGFTMEDNIRWREEAYEPEKYLAKDETLKRTLSRLSARYALGVVTNNPVSIAKRTLASLGVEDSFSAIVGLDTCMVAKPHALPFTTILERFNTRGAQNISAETAVSIGDRYEIDLTVPLELGMGAIQVDGVQDVYTLPELL